MTTTGDGIGKCDCPLHRPARAAGLAFRVVQPQTQGGIVRLTEATRIVRPRRKPQDKPIDR